MLTPSEMTVDGFHLADGKVDHLLEDLWVIEFRIFAIQFWRHHIVHLSLFVPP
jgi:hypothetical protein